MTARKYITKQIKKIPMKKYRFTSNKLLFVVAFNGTTASVTPDTPAVGKHLTELHRLLPIKRKGKPITFHERHASRLAQWLRLLIFQGEGVDLTVEEVRDVEKKWPPWEVRERDEYS